MRLAALLLTVFLLALAGCGGEEETTAPAPVNHTDEVAEVQSAFERDESCKPAQGASRWGCSVGSYRCQGVVTGRGWSVSCAKPGRSIVFRIQPG
ncbi:MAG TPA: hypothetical protein VFT79_13445 [Solirubrobacterales bacterium]|nr:hypothetical protein [Solirubrobacterales bacterium]